jgi:hypothetical protein
MRPQAIWVSLRSLRLSVGALKSYQAGVGLPGQYNQRHHDPECLSAINLSIVIWRRGAKSAQVLHLNTRAAYCKRFLRFVTAARFCLMGLWFVTEGGCLTGRTTAMER